MKKTAILDRVVGHVMAWTARGNVLIQLTEKKHGLQRAHWRNMIANDNRERYYSTPRCSRLRAWDTESRIQEIEASL